MQSTATRHADYFDHTPRVSPEQAALRRDSHRCRFRFDGCRGRAHQVIMAQPDWLGGDHTTANLRAVCHHCLTIQLAQRDRAAAIFDNGNH